VQAGRKRSHYYGLSTNSSGKIFRDRVSYFDLPALAKRTATCPVFKTNHAFKQPDFFWLVDGELADYDLLVNSNAVVCVSGIYSICSIIMRVVYEKESICRCLPMRRCKAARQPLG
jgi:hypothetical protein